MDNKAKVWYNSIRMVSSRFYYYPGLILFWVFLATLDWLLGECVSPVVSIVIVRQKPPYQRIKVLTRRPKWPIEGAKSIWQNYYTPSNMGLPFLNIYKSMFPGLSECSLSEHWFERVFPRVYVGGVNTKSNPWYENALRQQLIRMCCCCCCVN